MIRRRPARSVDEHGPIGKKGGTEGIFQRPGNGDDSDALAFGGVVFDGMVGQAVPGEALRGHGDVVRERDLLLGGAGEGGGDQECGQRGVDLHGDTFLLKEHRH